jgi:hypothetical protein
MKQFKEEKTQRSSPLEKTLTDFVTVETGRVDDAAASNTTSIALAKPRQRRATGLSPVVFRNTKTYEDKYTIYFLLS